VSKIVNAMKEFSHPDREEKVLADLNRAIESTVAISRNEWKYVAELELELDPELQPVPCHPGGINQVVLNLVVNAAHAIGEVVGHSGDKGRITVRTRAEGPWAVIQVEDTGPGIPEAIQTRIFDPFFTTKGVGKGSGQGLAIARSVVVDKHGGTIGFDTQPGQGTLFTIRLPIPSGAG
jgi:signal transduction histidine kinase